VLYYVSYSIHGYGPVYLVRKWSVVFLAILMSVCLQIVWNKNAEYLTVPSLREHDASLVFTMWRHCTDNSRHAVSSTLDWFTLLCYCDHLADGICWDLADVRTLKCPMVNSPRGRLQSVVINMSVCLSVSITLLKFLCVLPVAVAVSSVQYAMYFRFCGWRHGFT